MLGALLDEDVKKLVAQYHREGYCVIRDAFEPYEVAAWAAECERLSADKSIVHPDNMRTPFRHNAKINPERIDPVIDRASASPMMNATASITRNIMTINARMNRKSVVGLRISSSSIALGPSAAGRLGPALVDATRL